MFLAILLYTTFLLFSIGQLGRLSFYNQQINIYLYEVWLLTLISFFVFKYRLRPLIYFHRRFKSVYIFFSILFVSLIIGINNFSLFENLVGFLYFGRLSTYFVLFFYLAYHLKQNKSFEKTLLNALLMFIFSVAVTSLVQYLFYQDLSNLFYLGWDPHLYRLFGLFFDSYTAASIYGLLFFLVFLKFNGLSRKILAVVFFVFTLMTFSRMGYIALLTALFFYFYRTKAYKLIAISSVLFLTVVFLLPKPFGAGVNLTRLFSIKSRLVDYQKGLDLSIKKPLLGVGYNRVRYAKKAAGLIEGAGWESTHSGAAFHSSFLTILASAGILGLLSFIFMLYGFAKLNLLASAYTVFLSIFSLGDNALLHPFILFLFLTLLSLEVSLSSK